MVHLTINKSLQGIPDNGKDKSVQVIIQYVEPWLLSLWFYVELCRLFLISNDKVKVKF